jgi:3-hydroxyisobutyrate dehydrogenase
VFDSLIHVSPVLFSNVSVSKENQMAGIRKIGFIGIGNMGAPMAARLCDKGFEVAVHDIRADLAPAFVAAHGGRAAGSLAELAHEADAVIFMVPDDKVVHHILFDAGLAAHLKRGAVALDMSSSAPSGTLAIGAQLQPLGIDYVDAPVMGGVVFAADGTLDIMAGGDAALVERCRPLFDAMGRKLYHCGLLGSAHMLKSLTQYINACALINTLEAMVAGRKFGLDSQVMAEAIDAMCNGRQHPVLKKVIPHVLTRKYGTGMAMGFIAKDVGIAVESARSVGAAMPLGEKTAQLWAAACEQLGGTLDQTEIVRFWEAASQVEL